MALAGHGKLKATTCLAFFLSVSFSVCFPGSLGGALYFLKAGFMTAAGVDVDRLVSDSLAQGQQHVVTVFLAQNDLRGRIGCLDYRDGFVSHLAVFRPSSE